MDLGTVATVAFVLCALGIVISQATRPRRPAGPAPYKPHKPQRACRQCGKIYAPRTMMESLLHQGEGRNRTIGVFCPHPKRLAPERCAGLWEAAHPQWWNEPR